MLPFPLNSLLLYTCSIALSTKCFWQYFAKYMTCWNMSHHSFHICSYLCIYLEKSFWTKIKKHNISKYVHRRQFGLGELLTDFLIVYERNSVIVYHLANFNRSITKILWFRPEIFLFKIRTNHACISVLVIICKPSAVAIRNLTTKDFCNWTSFPDFTHFQCNNQGASHLD